MSELFEEFQEFRKILCICPCCGMLVRVSDLKIKVKGKGQKTWLDSFEKLMMQLDDKIAKFDEQEEKLREIAHEKGRKQAAVVFNKAISPKLKALKYDPFDIKPILNPVDFVVFNGMNKTENVNDIIFLSKETSNLILKDLRKQVNEAILQSKYDWQVARIDDDGKIEFE